MIRLIRWWFWWCAGAKPQIIENLSSDQEKYLSMGLAIFLTGVVATLTMAYAMNFVFNEPIIAILVGIVWGLVIFNLDRSLTLTMRKTQNSYDEYLFSEKIASLIPQVSLMTIRIVLALIVGHAIAVPLELKLFEESVLKEVEKQNLVENSRREDDIRKSFSSFKEGIYSDIEKYKSEIERYRAEMIRLEEQKGERKKQYDYSLDKINNEIHQVKERHFQERESERLELANLEEKLKDLKQQEPIEVSKLTTSHEKLKTQEQMEISTLLKLHENLRESEAKKLTDLIEKRNAEKNGTGITGQPGEGQEVKRMNAEIKKMEAEHKSNELMRKKELAEKIDSHQKLQIERETEINKARELYATNETKAVHRKEQEISRLIDSQKEREKVRIEEEKQLKERKNLVTTKYNEDIRLLDELIKNQVGHIKNKTTQINEREKSLKLKEDEQQKTIGIISSGEQGNSAKDFLLMLQALYDLIGSTDGTKWTHFTFLVIIILVEIFPVFIKFINPRGAYDAEITKIERLKVAEADAAVYSYAPQVSLQPT